MLLLYACPCMTYVCRVSETVAVEQCCDMGKKCMVCDAVLLEVERSVGVVLNSMRCTAGS